MLATLHVPPHPANPPDRTAAPPSAMEDRLLSLIREKDDVIRAQAEEIGRLREQIRQMQQRFEKDSTGAGTGSIASAG